MWFPESVNAKYNTYQTQMCVESLKHRPEVIFKLRMGASTGCFVGRLVDLLVVSWTNLDHFHGNLEPDFCHAICF